MSTVTTHSSSSSAEIFGPSCAGGGYEYSQITDDPGLLADWTASVVPDIGSLSLTMFISDTIAGSWVYSVVFNGFVNTRSYGFGDENGLYYYGEAHIGSNTIEIEGTGLGGGGASGGYSIAFYINDYVSATDYIILTVTCSYKPRMRPGVGFNRGWLAYTGGSPGPMFKAAGSSFPSGCPGGSLSGSTFYPYHELTYDPNIVTAGNEIGQASSSPGSSGSSALSSSEWSQSHSSGGTWLTEEILRFAQSGSESSVYRLDHYTKSAVIAVIGSGQLDIEVSNDGTDFVTYDSLTSDGYVECEGFKYIKLSVASGEVTSATLSSQRKVDRISPEPSAKREVQRLGRLMGRRGWSRGDG